MSGGSATGGVFGRRRPVVRLNHRCDDPPTTTPLKVRAPGRRRVGVLGGSFNPAHEGHRAISLEALKRLDLDQVWWLVSPQNPLKPKEGMADFSARMASASDMVADHPRLVVTDLEQKIGTRYTVDTVKWLVRKGKNDFVWLIGSDNLLQLPKWRDWESLFNLVPIAVFDREPYSYNALAGRAARAFAARRIDVRHASDLVRTDLPAWVYFRLRRHRASSTAIRSRRAWPVERAGRETVLEQEG